MFITRNGAQRENLWKEEMDNESYNLTPFQRERGKRGWLNGTRGVDVTKDAVNNRALSTFMLFTRVLASKNMLPHHKSRCAILKEEDSRRGPRRLNENPYTFCCTSTNGAFSFHPSSVFIGHNIYGLQMTAFIISRALCSKLRLWYLLFLDKSQVTCLCEC